MDTPELSISNTTHSTQYTDALDGLRSLDSESVHLTVTSPPYPMIEMWDDIFADCSPQIKTAIEQENWKTAYEEMHNFLNQIWTEVIRVTVENGIIAINIGNATRRVNDSFKLYPNIQPIINHFTSNGCEMLPFIHWNKASNKSSSFMGSGTIPTNAYVTNDHEYILLFRKGEGTRDFEPNHTRRYQSAYFWEERNDWFSDRWTFQGEQQVLNADGRERSGAFPQELPYRLINMYSIYGDTVLDPFLGTGTTQATASLLGRNSIGFELDQTLKQPLLKTLTNLTTLSKNTIKQRIKSHKTFIENTNKSLPYESPYGAVKTSYETSIILPEVESVNVTKRTDEALEWKTELTAASQINTE